VVPVCLTLGATWPLSQGISLGLEAQGQNRDISPLKEEANVLNDIH